MDNEAIHNNYAQRDKPSSNKNEIVFSIKDKSAHSVILKDNNQALLFTDFIQSVIEKKHKITDTKIVENSVEIIKE